MRTLIPHTSSIGRTSSLVMAALLVIVGCSDSSNPVDGQSTFAQAENEAALGAAQHPGFAAASSHATSPLDDGGWELVAHMSNEGGMFDGDGDLAPGYSYGNFVENPSALTPDFQRAFPVVANKILFITGDRTVWGLADHSELRALIDDKKSASLSELQNPNSLVFAPNLAFEIKIDGVASSTEGNVLSRAKAPWLTDLEKSLQPPAEDPWISISGNHQYGYDNGLIVWGEGNFAGGYNLLKNSRGGIDVYVRPAVATDKAQCKNGGWQDVRRSDWSAFKNQGDCVSYVASQR